MADAPELWKPIAGYGDRYEVSDLGRVRNVFTGRVLKPGRMGSGHMSVALGRGNSRTVHTIVIEAFVGPAPAGLECRHRDGEPSHNWLGNLVYGTRSQNIQDIKWHKPRRNHKLTGADARCVKLLLAGGVSFKDIATLYDCSKSLIKRTKYGEMHVDA